MGRKLSQPGLRSASRGWPGLVLGLSLAALLATAGCSRVEDGAAADLGGGGLARSAVPTSPSPAEPFAWPADPSHPVLRIEIAGAGIEGTIEIELMPELAPQTVEHVLEFARSGLYDGTTFHRVIPGFMIQGGDPNSRDRDPTNDGEGGPGVAIRDEFGAAPFERGVVAMGNKGRTDSGGSQFFIMHAEVRDLDGRYTVIGRVDSGMDVVDAIAAVETDRYGRWGPRDRPIENVVMQRVRVDDASRTAEIGEAVPARSEREPGIAIVAADPMAAE